jgi:hypothetical protein
MNHNHSLTFPLAVSAASLMLISNANAATLALDSTTTLGTAAFNVSVNSTNSGFSGNVGNGTFSDPILDYDFFHHTAPNTITSYAPGGALIDTPTGSSTGNESYVTLWTTSDPDSAPGTPGIDFGTTPDHTNSGSMTKLKTATGTVHINGLTSGSLYLFFGAYRGTATFNLTLSGGGQADVLETFASVNIFPGSTNTTYVSQFSFADAADYDTLTYVYTHSASDTQGRLGGAVLTSAIPEPSSSALLGLGGLALILRRRK